MDDEEEKEIVFNEKNIPCPSIRYSLFIDCEGNVYPCNSWYYKVGNIYESSLKNIWENSEQYKLLNSIRNEDLTECKACEMKDCCTRCPGHAMMEDGNMYGCSSIDRRYAKIIRRRKN